MHTPEGSQKLAYAFNWSSLRNNSRFNLSKVILRLYKHANFTKECSKATLQAKVFCRHASGESEFTGIVRPVNMSNNRDWEELDLTAQFRLLWPIPNGSKQVHVIITLQSQCDNNELPIKFYDLKSISKLKLRRKFYSHQPVLCLYLNDDVAEKLARSGGQHVESIPSDEVLSMSLKNNRPKRDTTNDCRKVDHIISFEELNIPFVILPIEYNAGRCIGTCNAEYLYELNKNREFYKLNNYAKLLATQAHTRNKQGPTICCSPGEYDPLMVLIATADGSSVKQTLYPEMRIRECYCR